MLPRVLPVVSIMVFSLLVLMVIVVVAILNRGAGDEKNGRSQGLEGISNDINKVKNETGREIMLLEI